MGVVIFVQLLVSIAQLDPLERKQLCFCPFVLALGYEQPGPQVHYLFQQIGATLRRGNGKR